MTRCRRLGMVRAFPATWALIGVIGMGGPLPAMPQDSDTPKSSAWVRPAFGTIAGVIRSSAKVPIGGATVTATRADGQGIRTTISGSDGIYSFADVTPGEYLVTTEADGYPDATVSMLQVVAGRATRVDIAMAASVAEPLIVASSDSSTPKADGSDRSTAQPNPAPANAARGAWPRWLTALLAPKKQAPAQTASLQSPPVAAFDQRAEAEQSGPVPSDSQNIAPQTNVSRSGPLPTPPAMIAPSANRLPDAILVPAPGPPVDNETPFAYGDFTWLNGSPRNRDAVLDTKFFTPEIRFDIDYFADFNQPKDHTIGGSTEAYRSGEVQLEQISVGGDFHWDNVRGRILTMAGLDSPNIPRNDASVGVGQWNLSDAYKYFAEAYAGYHWNVNHGLNVDAGIFASYVGLLSGYNFDNWSYQASYVSSNTPWFFNGVRVQWFPTNKLKIEPWFINGWQSYAKFNGHPGLGGQVLWQPHEWLKVVLNQYFYGQDNVGLPKTQRLHTDDSVLVRYYNHPESAGITKMAFTLTGDAGCQTGGGISCTHGYSDNKSSFLGWQAYHRIWWHKDLFAVTVGGGYMNNPGRYLTLLPPIDGATAVSGTPYFTTNPGQKSHMSDGTLTFNYMPKEYITWWTELSIRHSDIPYWTGRQGVTPPGGNNGAPQYYTCSSSASAGTANLAAAEMACGGGMSSIWFPDLRKGEVRIGAGVMVKF